MASSAFKHSPAKRKPDEEIPAKVPAWTHRTPIQDVTDWDCPETGCDGVLIKKHTKTSSFLVCSQNIFKNDDSCQFTACFFRPDPKSPHTCLVCGKDVGGSASLGAPTDKVDPATGKTIWDNIHLFWSSCAGKKAAGKLALCTPASSDQVERTCAAYVEGTTYDDIKDGCTGLIREGDTVLKSWTSKPLHAWCGKRLWALKVEEYIQSKKKFKELGTSATEECKIPSADITEDLIDF